MSPHFNLLNAGGSAPRPLRTCSWWLPPRRLPDSEVSDAPRAYHAADGGAPTRTSWEQLLIVNRCFGAPRRSEDDQTRAEREEEDTGSLTHAWLSRPPPSSTCTATRCPPPAAERMRNDARAAGGPA
ncbi:hypothetical protein EVAR_44023_1 [Eumeta japonica]|uniref:Uncharacterized protein n=1 Tax=Eumeta variegata TaxID=151549 RepID=A0A4C1XIP1_EUMVA|nr:hypothetical protein EVAR_44023_1 [Eumeta japonica]